MKQISWSWISAVLGLLVLSYACSPPPQNQGSGPTSGKEHTGNEPTTSNRDRNHMTSPTKGTTAKNGTQKPKHSPDTPKGSATQKNISGNLAKLAQKIDNTTGNRRIPYHFGNAIPIPLEKDDKTLAPYFYIPKGENSSTEELPLKYTGAKVRIEGPVARVTVTQKYENRGHEPIEAIYVFPASTRAAIRSMRMVIGERVIEAKIMKRASARQVYEHAKQSGQQASLLEQERPNVFTMNVANIMPGDKITVELEYVELLEPEDGVYEFVYPVVVGPRYGGGAKPTDKWISNPYQKSGHKELYGFGIEVSMTSALGIKDVSSPSHGIDVKFTSPGDATVKLKEQGGGNRDFVLRYRLAGDRIQTGTFIQKGKDGGYFMVLMEPPARPKPETIPPREYIFILDISGSMHGYPLDTAKKLIVNLLMSLRPADMFDIILFSGGSFVMSPKSLPASPENVAKAIQLINGQHGGGGTELMQALETAYGIPKNTEGISRTMVLVTDGYVGVESQAFRMVARNVGAANLFSFGIGRSINRYLVEKVARAGGGKAFVALNPKDAQKVADKFEKYIRQPVLTGISVRFDGMSVTDDVPNPVPDLFASQPILIMGRYQGQPGGTVQITGFNGKGRFRKSVSLSEAKVLDDDTISTLWARKWIQIFTDKEDLAPQNNEIKDAITAIALKYHLMSRHTSFVAVDSRKVRKNGKLVTVKQPLPMPSGVSNLAVGRASGLGHTLGSIPRRPAVRRALRLKGTPARLQSPSPAAASKPLEDKSTSQYSSNIKLDISTSGVSPSEAGTVKNTASAKMKAIMPLIEFMGIKGTITVEISGDGKVRITGTHSSAEMAKIRRALQSVIAAVKTGLTKAGGKASMKVTIRITVE